MEHAEQIQWIKDHLTNHHHSHSGPGVDKDALKQARLFLESTDNLLALLNKLDGSQIPQFINTFMRPVPTLDFEPISTSDDESKPYQLLWQKIESGKPTNIDLVCYALVAHDSCNLDLADIKKALRHTQSQLSETIKKSLRAYISFMEAHENKSRIKPALPDNSFINLSLLVEPTFDMRNMSLRHAILDWAYLEKRKLKNIILSGSSINFGHFNQSDLTNATLSNCHLACCSFDKSILKNADLYASILDGASFQAADLRNAKLNQSQLNRTCFENACLNQASLNDMQGYSANFKNANLEQANIRDAHMHSCKFDSANMSKACMDKSEFNQSTFIGTNLREAILQDTSFLKSDLQGADLSYTVLTKTCFEDASLKDAVLVHAKLDNTNIKNTNFDNAHFFTAEHIANPGTGLKSELSWWHDQINSLPQEDRRILRLHILTDLTNKAKELPEDEKKNVFNTAYYHPIFQHRKKSLRGGVNRIFTKIEPPTESPKVPAKTPSQKLLEKALLPTRARKKLHVTRTGIHFN